MSPVGVSAVSVAFLIAAHALAPAVASAGVPRSCVHPNNDPIECPRETRLEHLDVLPSARLRVLQSQRPVLERTVVPVQDQERNTLLEQIRDRAPPAE